MAGWQLLLVGAASILAGVLYTGGPRPYGYEGLGELFVFLFFGIVAVAGSYFVQVEHLTGRRSRWPCRSACSPRRSSWSTTSATSTPTAAPASARSPCASAATRTRALYAVMVYVAYLLAPVTWVFGPLKPWVLLPWLDAPARRPSRPRRCATAPTARR